MVLCGEWSGVDSGWVVCAGSCCHGVVWGLGRVGVDELGREGIGRLWKGRSEGGLRGVVGRSHLESVVRLRAPSLFGQSTHCCAMAGRSVSKAFAGHQAARLHKECAATTSWAMRRSTSRVRGVCLVMRGGGPL